MINAAFKGRLPGSIADLAGAVSAAIITIPQAIGYGLIAFAALGSKFTEGAVLLGLYSAALAGGVAAIAGGTRIQITGPKAPMTLVIAGLVSTLAGISGLTNNSQDAASSIKTIVLLCAFCVAIAGVIQIALGTVRFGNIIKFVPHSVISGVMNGVAIWLVVSQLHPLMGLTEEYSLFNPITALGHIQPFTLISGLATLAAIYLAKRFLKGWPYTLAGIVAGCGTYFAIALIAPNATLGPTLGAVEFSWPKLQEFASVFDLAAGLDLSVVLPLLLITGLILAIIGSTESLLSAVVADNLTGTRHHSNRELIGQGLGNLTCAAFGALPAAGSIPRTAANHHAGGHSRLSGVASAAIVLLAIPTLGPALGYLPLAVIAGIIISVGIDLFDDWTLNLVNKLKTHTRQRRELVIELFVTTVVAVLTITGNLVVGVITGMVLASALTIWQLSRSIVRRQYEGCQVRSRKIHNEQDYLFLQQSRGVIKVLELQGPLFFASADNLAIRIESDMMYTDYFILDMKRVTDIDGTGARILLRTAEALQRDDKHLLICHLSADTPLWEYLEMMDVVTTVGEIMFFQDTDRALEWAEDNLLSKEGHETAEQIEDVASLDIAKGLTQGELEILRSILSKEKYVARSSVFTEGETDNAVYLVLSGSITISKSSLGEQEKRLITFGPGSMLGEMSFVDQRTRSATARADVDSELLRFSYHDFQTLQEQKPQLAVKLLANIGYEISSKLRRTSRALAVMEDA